MRLLAARNAGPVLTRLYAVQTGVSTAFPRISRRALTSASGGGNTVADAGVVDDRAARKHVSSESTMPNSVILIKSTMGCSAAKRERFVRHVMAVKDIEWEDADAIATHIQEVQVVRHRDSIY